MSRRRRREPLGDPDAPLLSLEDVSFAYKDGPRVLAGTDLQLQRGESVALLGASGSGKSTLLFLAGLLSRPTSGSVRLAGIETAAMAEAEREILRNQRLGFVFQHHFLLPDFSAEGNVALPSWSEKRFSQEESLERAREILAFVGLRDKLKRMPSQLSGGERQRVSIARALSHRPELVLADEPTGSLDSENGDRVFELLFELQGASQCGILLVTHNPLLAERCNRVVRMVDGKIVETLSKEQDLPGIKKEPNLS